MDTIYFPTANSPVLFQCSQCGECCSGDMKVRLNLHDLYILAARSGSETTSALFGRTVELLREKNGLYLPYLKFRQHPFPFCPFLENSMDENFRLTGLCRLHPDDKPLVCRLSPVGRRYDSLSDSESYYFLPPHDRCPGKNENIEKNLEEWISPWRRELDWEKQFFRLLDNLLERNEQELSREIYYFRITGKYTKILDQILSRFFRSL